MAQSSLVDACASEPRNLPHHPISLPYLWRLLQDNERTKHARAPPIVVTGTHLKINKDSNGGGWLGYLEQGYDGEPNPTLSPEGSGSGGPYEPMDPANDTPCVTASPAGYSLVEINNVAKSMASDIAKENDGAWEYGGAIFGSNGQIGFTGIVTQQNVDRVSYPISQIPDGAVILALVHNQPNQHGSDESWPSDVDWDLYGDLQDGTIALPRGITVDPNILMYVYTDEDFQTRVYDKNDKDNENEQCAL